MAHGTYRSGQQEAKGGAADAEFSLDKYSTKKRKRRLALDDVLTKYNTASSSKRKKPKVSTKSFLSHK